MKVFMHSPPAADCCSIRLHADNGQTLGELCIHLDMTRQMLFGWRPQRYAKGNDEFVYHLD